MLSLTTNEPLVEAVNVTDPIDALHSVFTGFETVILIGVGCVIVNELDTI